MYRNIAIALSLAGVALVLLCQPGNSPAQVKTVPVTNQPSLNRSPTPQLPVTQIVLFTSGVGYFERTGEVQGSTSMELSFPVGNINDLLKSLVLQDLGGGQIRAVSYDSHDPAEKTLKSFALDLTKNPSLGQLLTQARGEKVEVEWQGQTLQGTIIGVEQQRQPVGKEGIVEVELFNILTTTGLRSLPLSQVQRIRLLNPFLENELQRALVVLATTHDTQKRTVTLNFHGEGKRPVRVGYVIENPVWKTSYRLALDRQGQPVLQGWAIVDNVSAEDWQNVQVTLVSGRPISFIMDLYTPLYVPRPVVELEQFAHLRPPTYSAPMEAQREARGRLEERAALTRPAAAPAADARLLDLQRGVSAQTTTQEVGDFFQYVSKQPVNLPRQKSAMLPIVNQPIEGTRCSIYNASVHVRHPLLGLKLRNTTDLHLMQGPITVFESGSYAGDARIPNLQPKEERLLSYAVDQGTEVEPVAKSVPEQLMAVKVVKGILHATSRLRQTKTYNIKNRSTQDRLVLLEHPFRADWALVTPEKPAERSREVYRFQVAVPAGQSASQEVVEEQSRVDRVILGTADDQTIQLYLTSNVTSPRVREALQQALALKVKLAESTRQIGQVEQQIKGIVEDQVRLRANMARVPENSPPYQRYMKKLDEQETQIETLQAQVATLRRNEDEHRRRYEVFLLNLNLE